MRSSFVCETIRHQVHTNSFVSSLTSKWSFLTCRRYIASDGKLKTVLGLDEGGKGALNSRTTPLCAWSDPGNHNQGDHPDYGGSKNFWNVTSTRLQGATSQKTIIIILLFSVIWCELLIASLNKSQTTRRTPPTFNLVPTLYYCVVLWSWRQGSIP
jgi:hypothetical protein